MASPIDVTRSATAHLLIRGDQTLHLVTDKMGRVAGGFAKAVLCTLLMALLLGHCPIECWSTDFDVTIEGATIFDYTYQVLDRLRVDDQRGIRRIKKLNPPAFHECPDEITWFNNLRMWLRENMDHGKGLYYFPTYPPTMIELMRSSKSCPVTCGFFSVAYAGLLLCFDIPVRLIHVYGDSGDGEIISHTFNEVWSEQYQRWIVQDVDHNVFWINEKGSPANAFEIQRETQRCGRNLSCYHIKPYRSFGGEALTEKIRWDAFQRLVISFQSNYYGVLDGGFLEHQIGSLFHLKSKCENEENDPAWLRVKKILGIKSVENCDLLYAPLNQIVVAGFDKGDQLDFCLRNNILNFDHYEIKKSLKEWERLDRQQRCFSYGKELCHDEREIGIMGVSKRGHRTRQWMVKIKPSTE